MYKKPQSVTLIVLDGFGVAPPSIGNAIALANIEHLERLAKKYPTFTLQASGESVGLPWGEQGNSEVGHLTLGTGRIIYQSLPRITKSISDGTFVKNKALLGAMQHVKKNHTKLHLIGLVSDGGVHSYNEHLYALLELCKQQELQEVYIHAILDGRDVPRDSGARFMEKLQAVIKNIGIGKVATVSGRFYAMDRDNHWERIARAYQAMVDGVAQKKAHDPLQAIKDAYEQGVYDEEMEPVVITENNEPVARIADGDGVVVFNFRPDRVREITKALTLDDFSGFPRKKKRQLFVVTMTEYEKGLPVHVAFPPLGIERPLSSILSAHKIKQFHIAETEKYAHVTYFFNGGHEEPFPYEDHVLVPSPRVDVYAEKPEMAAKEITKKLLNALSSGAYQFLLVNYANADMVAHTGDIKATIKAIELLDDFVSKIVSLSLHNEGAVIITADHGNAEEVIKLKTGQVDKEHTSNPVPLLLIGAPWEGQSSAPSFKELYTTTPVGVLADVAPTILKLFDIEKPPEMTGQPLV